MAPFSQSHTLSLWPRKDGPICPFGLLPSFFVMSVHFEANPCNEANCGLFYPCFALVLQAFGCLGSWNPNSSFVLFNLQDGPFYTPKPLRFKVNMSKRVAKNTTK